MSDSRTPTLREVLIAGFVLTALTLLYWKFRIIDLGADPSVMRASLDLYMSHYPMTSYGFSALRAAHLPFWNPYQLCGMPFLAIPYVGLFYPPNLLYVLFDVTTAIEILFLFHMLFGGLSMWWLIRHLGMGFLGAVCAAVTFMWSGWMILQANQPTLLAALAWTPLTVLLLDLVLAGSRPARLGLVLAIACQVLLGAAEILLHTMYVGALFTFCRLMQLAWRYGWASTLPRAGIVMACLVAGVLLSAFQLLPSLELISLGGRTPGSLSFEQVLFLGFIRPFPFLRSALETDGMSTVGLLPLLGMTLAIGFREQRFFWCFCVVAAVCAALLVFGGWFFRLYYMLPVGSMFRRPTKFLDIYSFAQAGLAGLAVARLRSWQGEGVRTTPAWLASIALGFVAVAWLASSGVIAPYLIVTLGLLVVFGVVSQPGLRLAIIMMLCLLQGVNLFLGTGNRFVRPATQPEIFASHRDLIAFVKERIGHDRAYFSARLWFIPGLTPKQGTLRELNVVHDYEPLAIGRYATFFRRLEGGPPRMNPFAGGYDLQPTSRWDWLNLASTRYFVVRRGDRVDRFLAGKGRPRGEHAFRLVRDGDIRVYENRRALPRAYIVPRARVLAGPAEVLAALDDPDFDPRKEVLLEGPIADALAPAANGSVVGRVTIRVDEPERVVVDVTTDAGGVLVLTDLLYPGWEAFVGNQRVPVHRANFLFRAVSLEAGTSEVQFKFRSRPFRSGVMVSAATALALAGIVGWTVRRRSHRPRSAAKVASPPSDRTP